MCIPIAPAAHPGHASKLRGEGRVVAGLLSHLPAETDVEGLVKTVVLQLEPRSGSMSGNMSGRSADARNPGGARSIMRGNTADLTKRAGVLDFARAGTTDFVRGWTKEIVRSGTGPLEQLAAGARAPSRTATKELGQQTVG